MAAKRTGHERRKASSLSTAYTNFQKPHMSKSNYRRSGNYGRNNLNFKRDYEYRKPPSEKPVADMSVSEELQHSDERIMNL